MQTTWKPLSLDTTIHKSMLMMQRCIGMRLTVAAFPCTSTHTTGLSVYILYIHRHAWPTAGFHNAVNSNSPSSRPKSLAKFHATPAVVGCALIDWSPVPPLLHSSVSTGEGTSFSHHTSQARIVLHDQKWNREGIEFQTWCSRKCVIVGTVLLPED